MASASHSFVIVTLKTRTVTVSSTSAATNSGTKKIRAIVRMLGRFITPIPTIIRRPAMGQLRRAATLMHELTQALLERLRDLGIDVAIVLGITDINHAAEFVQQ